MTAREVVHRRALVLARTTLHRMMESVFVLVDSVAAGQAPGPPEDQEEE